MAPTEDQLIVTEAQIVSRDWRRSAVPTFSVHEVAKVFFAMSPSWIRLMLNADDEHPNTYFVNPDGTRMEFRRRDPDKPADRSARLFLLSDIEPMAISLFRFSRISGLRLTQIREIVLALAELYDLTPEPDGS